MFRQTKHRIFEFTAVNKYLFVHSELNTLPSLSIFHFLFSVIAACSLLTTCSLLTNKLKMLVEHARTVNTLALFHEHSQLTIASDNH